MARRPPEVRRARRIAPLTRPPAGRCMVEPDRIPLALLPTPLVRLARLGATLGGEVWVKRDDLTGLELSGNKVRKLEYVVADALRLGCDTLVTEGTSQSNHCRATAAVCARVGLRCVLLLRPPPPDGPPRGNHLLDVLFGAETRCFARPDFDERREAIVAGVCNELAAEGRRPRWTPMGASEPLGCWGYLRAARELGDQLDASGIGGCDVVVAISSGGTYAGALLGALLSWRPERTLWAVPVSDDVGYHAREVQRLCRASIATYALPVEFDADRMRFIGGYVGDGYAIPYARAIQSLRELARCEGVILDPVYTAKAFCAVCEAVREGRLGRARPVVFWHTGGIFSDFNWPAELLDGA